MRRAAVLLASSLIACGGAPPPAAPRAKPPEPCTMDTATPPPPSMDDIAQKLVSLFNAHDARGVVALYGDDMARAFPVEKTATFVDGIVAGKGPLVSVAREGAPHGGWTPYRLKAERGDWKLELGTKDGRVTGLQIAPWPSAPPVAKSALPLRLPFKGEWFVTHGGSTKETNAHVDSPSQRRAADLVRVDASGKSHKGDGKANADYYAYGAEILAVADGTVVTAIDGVPENDPPNENPYSGIGNAIFLAHDGGVWSVYAHLQPGSLRVKAGARVKRGDVLGLCGNSGNSTEPHLHFQLQDGPRFESSWGVEPVFPRVRLTRAGKTENVATYTFLRGDRIEEPP